MERVWGYPFAMPRIRATSIDEHKALTRTALLEAAKDLIAATGTADIPLGEIALSAGVGRTTLYDYFDDRDDLIATLVEEELPGVVSHLIESASQAASPSDRLVELAVRTVEFVVGDPVLGLILHREAGRMSPEAQQRIRAAHAGLADEMVALYFRGVESGEFRAMPPDLAGRLIQDTIMSAAKTVISAPQPEERIAVVTEHLRSFLVGGLSYTG
jgi:AcrR family transcriptional regulator